MFREKRRVIVGTAVLVTIIGVAIVGIGVFVFNSEGNTGNQKCELIVNVEGSGAVELEPKGGFYEEGTHVTIKAVPLLGADFLGWSGDVGENSSTITVEMDSDKHFVARFSALKLAPSEVKKTVEKSNEFALDLFARLVENGGGNAFISPWSLYKTLSMTYEGARGETAEGVKKAVHLPENERLRRSFFVKIRNTLSESRGIDLKTGNALWVQSGYPIREKYVSLSKRFYGAKAGSLDFKDNSAEARHRINNWVAKKTENNIKKLVTSSSVNSLTRFVLANSIFFKGKWAKPFPENRTEPENFWVSPGERVKVPMMTMGGMERSVSLHFNHAETGDMKVLELPYQGKDFSMLLLLPKSRFGLENILERLNTEKLNEITSRLDNQIPLVLIRIPKFEFKSTYHLEKPLESMGMRSAFRKNADFSRIADTEKPLFLFSVLHKVRIKVSERGTKASAATGISGGMGHPPFFVADHPFIFLIRHKDTGIILFAGKVSNPAK